MNIGEYNAAASRMLKEVEHYLFLYGHMKQEIWAYEARCTEGTGRVIGNRAASTLPGDPTGNGAVRLVEPGSVIESYRGWVGVIEKARGEMEYFAPELAIILVRFFALDDTYIKCKKSRTSIRYALMEELSLSQTTLYNRKGACVEWVKALALHKGLLCPDMPYEGHPPAGSDSGNDVAGGQPHC